MILFRWISGRLCKNVDPWSAIKLVKINPFYFQIAAARCPSCLSPSVIQSACISIEIALHGAKVTWELWLGHGLVSLSEKTSEAITALEHVPYHAPSPPDAQLSPPLTFSLSASSNLRCQARWTMFLSAVVLSPRMVYLVRGSVLHCSSRRHFSMQLR